MSTAGAAVGIAGPILTGAFGYLLGSLQERKRWRREASQHRCDRQRETIAEVSEALYKLGRIAHEIFLSRGRPGQATAAELAHWRAEDSTARPVFVNKVLLMDDAELRVMGEDLFKLISTVTATAGQPDLSDALSDDLVTAMIEIPRRHNAFLERSAAVLREIDDGLMPPRLLQGLRRRPRPAAAAPAGGR